ncbi:MAG: phosphodiester glycosidase family protein [Candidatus Aenigmatarchaeota archaeon]
MNKLTRREFIKNSASYLASLIIGINDDNKKPNVVNYKPVYKHNHKYKRGGKFSHSKPTWCELRKGLYFTRLIVYRDNEPVDSMGLVKADPNYNKFRVFHDRENPKTIEKWQEYTNADVIFNSSYYQDTLDPVGLIITNGKMKGPKVNKAMKGMFVAEPVDDRKPKATIIDFSEELFDYKNPKWMEGVQSFPMLLDKNGNIGVKNSRWYANRTVLCTDRDGNIIVLTTEGGYFSLYDMGLFLRESELNIKNALNMDGGYEAEMMVKTDKLIYLTYGQWETQGKIDISIPWIHIRIPAVIGIFPRK